MPKRHPYLVAVGAHIREFRQKAGHTQESFANAADLDRTYVGGIERGERNLAMLNLIQIAQTLGRDPSDLIPPMKVIRASGRRSR